MFIGLYAVVYYIRTMVGLLRNVLQGSAHGSPRPRMDSGADGVAAFTTQKREIGLHRQSQQSPGFMYRC